MRGRRLALTGLTIALLVMPFALVACGGDDPGAIKDPPSIAAACEGDACSFCDPKVWGGVTPDATTDLVIPDGMTVVVDCAAEAHTLRVEAGGTLAASRKVSATLTMHGNLVVAGTVDYGTPEGRIPAGVTAEIIFTGMKDEGYQGTPSVEAGDDGSTSVETPIQIVDGDIGLWVAGSGRLLAAGQEKRAWGRLTDGAGPADLTFTVDDASGWQVGDRVTLTPTVPRSAGETWASQFDEAKIAAVEGNTVTLEAEPSYAHDGCSDCMRRGEAANLTRNVVIRSADDTSHAHIMVLEQGIAQLDSVELRWLGPEKCGGPARRAALYFGAQKEASDPSFVRHAAIWGGQKGFVVIEKSHGIEVSDVAGYDAYGPGFSMFYDTNGCGTRCADRAESAPHGIVFDHVLAAKVGAAKRDEEGACLRIEHRLAGFEHSGGEGSGARDCVAVGIGWEGSGSDVAGFGWTEGGSGRPDDFTFTGNVTHNSGGHGAMVWHNDDEHIQAPYTNNEFWSNGGYGIHWGAYGNPFEFDGVTIVDNGLDSVAIKAIPATDRPRMVDVTLESVTILSYVFVQTIPATFRNLTFTGTRPVGVSRTFQEACPDAAKDDDPNDPDCIRDWLRFENISFAAGMKPFDFGNAPNKHSVWEIRGFSSPDHAMLPADFDLYRADNEVPGGSYYEPFDAWLVPR
ncbi:G8 domain-containing protein [Polyangium jinanense]|uniref:G8 domain-containing protein n=1 Tax=Polyangium jinanense TaxID=2829994 RepID=A0A9X3X9U6_9BACT|nr:G8 domain-containing protein [Polyangium jinanense]MDC3958819.1 G8 domain-containing protein [Polyangium jinanense]MDC3985200.1 G8 domain-containing protein [Polyangium jinanense]